MSYSRLDILYFTGPDRLRATADGQDRDDAAFHEQIGMLGNNVDGTESGCTARRDTVTNPTLIVEVLSPSTKSYDIGEKARLFRMAPSLREFLLIEQETIEVEHWRRLPNGNWELATIRDANTTLHLESIDCDLPVAETYRNTEDLA